MDLKEWMQLEWEHGMDGLMAWMVCLVCLNGIWTGKWKLKGFLKSA